MKPHRRLFCGTILASGFALSAPAIAEPTGPGVELAEITVTAQKRPELLSKTALAMSAVTGQALESAGVVSPLTLGNIVPSAQVFQANGIQIVIRGVTSSDGTEKGDPSAAFMLDGIYLARQQSIAPAFFDVDRVEVLRGPQGTLYGRNSTAGVVNVISNRPQPEFGAYLRGEVGNYDTHRTEGMINLPVSDSFDLRFAGSYNKHDSYLENGTGVAHHLGGDEDEYAGRLSGLWKFGSSRQGSLLLIADYAHDGGAGPQPVRIQDFYTNYTTTNPVYIGASSNSLRTVRYPFAFDQSQDNKSFGFTAELNYDFGPFAATYLGAYRAFDRYNLEILAFPLKVPGRYPDTYATGNTHQPSHELRFSKSIPGVFDAVVGLYYFKEDTPNSDTILKDYGSSTYYAFLYNDVAAESKAVFGQATYHVTDVLRLTGGVRYSEDHKLRVGKQYNQTVPSSFLDLSLASVAGIADADVKFSAVTWKTGLEYDVTDRVLAYVNVSTGYKAGGFNDGCAAGSPSCTAPVPANRLFYQPEKLTAYEAGLKGRYFDRTLSLNLTTYYYDYTNLQLSSQQEPPAPPGLLTLNAAKATVLGGEIEAIYTPTSKDRFDFSAALTSAQYSNYYPVLTVSFHGKQLDYAPEQVFNLGYTHTFPLGNGGNIKAYAGTRYSSSFVVSDFNVPTQFRQPSYTLSNANISYHAPNDHWYLETFIKNIEDHVTFSGYSSGRVYVSEPRLFGVRAGLNFQ